MSKKWRGRGEPMDPITLELEEGAEEVPVILEFLPCGYFNSVEFPELRKELKRWMAEAEQKGLRGVRFNLELEWTYGPIIAVIAYRDPTPEELAERDRKVAWQNRPTPPIPPEYRRSRYDKK
jgi:hypothetical protein